MELFTTELFDISMVENGRRLVREETSLLSLLVRIVAQLGRYLDPDPACRRKFWGFCRAWSVIRCHLHLKELFHEVILGQASISPRSTHRGQFRTNRFRQRVYPMLNRRVI